MTTSTTTSVHRSSNHLGLPPPLSFELHDADRRVGWIDGDTIGFRGFASEAEAAQAAWVAYRAVAARLARRRRTTFIPVHGASLTVARRGDAELIVAGTTPIAQLIRPGAGSGVGGDAFAFTIRVPPPASELVVRGTAHLVHRTLRKSGIPWALVDAPSERETRLALAEARADARAEARAAAEARASSQPSTHAGDQDHDSRAPRRRPWRLPTLPWRRADRLAPRPLARPAGVRG